MAELTLDATIGFSGHVQNGLNCCNIGGEECVVYPLGAAIVIRNLKTKEQSFLQGHTGTVTCLDVSPNGRYCASGQVSSGKAAIRIWDLEAAVSNGNGGGRSGELCTEFKLHHKMVRLLKFSPDGKFLASCGGQDDNSLVIWDIELGHTGGWDNLEQQSISCCGTPISTSGSAFSIVWANALYCGSTYHLVCAGDAFIKSFSFSGNTKKFVGTRGGLACKNNAAGTARQYYSLVFTHDDSYVVAGTKSGELFVFGFCEDQNSEDPTCNLKYSIDLAVNTKRGGTPFAGGVQQIEAVEVPKHWARAGIDHALLCGGGAGSIRMVKLTSSPKANHPTGNGNIGFSTTVMGGAFSISPQASVNGQYWVGTSEGNMYSMNLVDDVNDDDQPQFYPVLMTSAHVGAINAVCYPKGTSDLVVTAGKDIRIWNTKIRAELLRIQLAHGLTCSCLDITADGKLIISGWSDGNIRGFFPESGRLAFKQESAHLNDGVTSLAVYHDTNIYTQEECYYDGKQAVFHFVSGGADGRVRKWSVDYSQPETINTKLLASWKEHRQNVTDIKIMTDNSKAVSSSEDGSCIIWDLETNMRYDALAANTSFQAIVFHPDQSQFLTCGSDRKITYYDSTDTKQPIRIIQGSDEGSKGASVNSVDVSGDGESFISGSADTLVKFWSYDEGECVSIGTGHSGEVNGVRVSPDNKRIISVGSEGAIMFWVVPEAAGGY